MTNDQLYDLIIRYSSKRACTGPGATGIDNQERFVAVSYSFFAWKRHVSGFEIKNLGATRIACPLDGKVRDCSNLVRFYQPLDNRDELVERKWDERFSWDESRPTRCHSLGKVESGLRFYCR